MQSDRKPAVEPEQTNPRRHPNEGPDAEHPLRRWESFIERQIREAQAAGQFDNLPHQGRRLPLEDDTAAGERAAGFRILRNAGAAPTWIEADKEIRHLLERRADLMRRAARSSTMSRDRYRAELTALVQDFNKAVLRLNFEAPTTAQHRQPLVLAEELARLEAAWERQNRR